MLRVGLTGGIASGKSHVLRRLAAAGVATLDLDTVAHDVMAPGGLAYRDVVRAFGESILAPDGTIDRKRLGHRVFSSPEARSRLNAVVHPTIRALEAEKAASFAEQGIALLVTDAALLVESGVHLRFHRLIVVHCREAEQLRRLIERDGLERRAAESRLEAQMPVSEKRRFAHFQVDTSGSVQDTDAEVERLVVELRDVAARGVARLPGLRERAAACLRATPPHGMRGLSTERVAEAILRARGIEMEHLAALLVPPVSGPWYRAGTPGTPGDLPSAVLVPCVLWALARRGLDLDYVAAVAVSAARLVHSEERPVAASCLFALALARAASWAPGEREDTADLVARTSAWAGPAPADAVRLVESAWQPDQQSPSLPAALAAIAGRVSGVVPEAEARLAHSLIEAGEPAI